MRGNKSPTPPVLTAPRGGVLNPKGINSKILDKILLLYILQVRSILKWININ
jgi:hypothetical protein